MFGQSNSQQFTKEFLLEVEHGNVPGYSLVHKFGRKPNVGTSYEPLTSNGIYQTPQVSAATTLRVKAGDANDTATGTGAREVTIQGVDETGAYQTESIATAGASPSSPTSTTWLRVFRSFVSSSGTYATATTGSHSDDIFIETVGGTEWTKIDSTDFARAQSQIGVYTVPLGKTGILLNYKITTNSNKAVDFAFFKRENILETSAPYTPMRLQFEEVGIQGVYPVDIAGGEEFSALTDFGFMVKAAATADVSIDFDILLIDD